ncbi:MAG TPA: glycosyltransferase family 2 protein [Candidatus Acidoferrales bacterium]|nr:glycosyltransferase family 2 protein [Candidatus Acidoferrales bacterium]
MKVSVIMPAYNRGYIIAEALGSIFAQTFPDFELIVIDDGSTDGTARALARLDDTRLRYVRHNVNRGYSCACNTGFREAQGEYVALLDSDDLWKPEKLAKDVEFLERHPEVDAVFTDLEKQDGSRRVPSFMRESPCMVALLSAKHWPMEVSFTQREMYLCLLQEIPVKPTAFVIRHTALNALGSFFDESWPAGFSDWEFLLRFSKRFRFGYIDKPLAVLRVQSDATHRLRAVADKTSVLKMLRAEATAAPDSEVRRAANAGYRDTVRHLSWEYLRRGQRLNAATALARGFLNSGDLGLLSRAAFALVRPKFHSGRHEIKTNACKKPDNTN